AEAGNRRPALVADDPESMFGPLLGVDVRGNVVDEDGADDVAPLLVDGEELCAVGGELDSPDTGLESPLLEFLPGANVPESHGVVGGAGGDDGGGGVYV